jgi:sigma-B regulation protein RsbU (phosphoserine phosphatase)
LLFRAGGGAEPLLLELTGMALGAVEEATWRQETVECQPGDALVLYTDGVVDAQNPDLVVFGQERLLRTLEGRLSASHDGDSVAHDLLDNLVAAVQSHTAGGRQFDDITLVVIRRDVAPIRRPPVLPVRPEPFALGLDPQRMGPPYRI